MASSHEDSESMVDVPMKPSPSAAARLAPPLRLSLDLDTIFLMPPEKFATGIPDVHGEELPNPLEEISPTGSGDPNGSSSNGEEEVLGSKRKAHQRVCDRSRRRRINDLVDELQVEVEKSGNAVAVPADAELLLAAVPENKGNARKPKTKAKKVAGLEAPRVPSRKPEKAAVLASALERLRDLRAELASVKALNNMLIMDANAAAAPELSRKGRDVKLSPEEFLPGFVRHLEASMSQPTNELNPLINSSLMIIFRDAVTGFVMGCNPAWERASGMRSKDAQGRKICEYVQELLSKNNVVVSYQELEACGRKHHEGDMMLVTHQRDAVTNYREVYDAWGRTMRLMMTQAVVFDTVTGQPRCFIDSAHFAR